MLKARERRVVALHVAVDVAVTCAAWLLAYALRFHEPLATLVPVTKGVPDVSRYLLLLPLVVVLWPPVLYFHGLYQIRRGRSLIDETFAILFSVLLASALTLGATLSIAPALLSGELVRVLPDYEFEPSAIFALYPSARQLSTKVRAALDYLAQHLKDPPSWDRSLAGRVPGF